MAITRAATPPSTLQTESSSEIAPPTSVLGGTNQDATPPTQIRDQDLDQFLAKSCGCKRANGKPCSTLFSKEHYQDIRWHCVELTRDELDLVLMGQIMATLSNDTLTQGAKFRHSAPQRKISSMAFFHGGHQICGKTFRKLHGIGMKTPFMYNGVSRPNTHPHTLSYQAKIVSLL